MRYSRSAASKRIRRLTRTMQGRSSGGVLEDVKRPRTRQSLIVLGGVVAAGFIVSKVVKKTGIAAWKNHGDGEVLDRDQDSPVSVSAKDGHPSYTYNDETTEAYDPHLEDRHKPDRRSSPGRRKADRAALDRDQPGPVSVSTEKGEPSYTYNAEKSESYDPNLADQSSGGSGGEAILDRDQHSPVSVSAKDKGGEPSYTHNAETTEAYDPHLEDRNKPGRRDSAGRKKTDAAALDRDQPGPVSVSPKNKEDDPSYTHNAETTEAYDPNLADQSNTASSKTKGSKKKS